MRSRYRTSAETAGGRRILKSTKARSKGGLRVGLCEANQWILWKNEKSILSSESGIVRGIEKQ